MQMSWQHQANLTSLLNARKHHRFSLLLRAWTAMMAHTASQQKRLAVALQRLDDFEVQRCLAPHDDCDMAAFTNCWSKELSTETTTSPCQVERQECWACLMIDKAMVAGLKRRNHL